jgi:hypothetical protein
MRMVEQLHNPLKLEPITGLMQCSKQIYWNISRRFFRSLCIVTTLPCSLAPFSSCTSRSSLRSFAENQSTPAAGQRLAHGASSSSAAVAVRGKLKLMRGSARAIGNGAHRRSSNLRAALGPLLRRRSNGHRFQINERTAGAAGGSA